MAADRAALVARLRVFAADMDALQLGAWADGMREAADVIAALTAPPEAPDCREAVRAALLEMRALLTSRIASMRVADAYSAVRDAIDAKLADLERQPTREGPC